MEVIVYILAGIGAMVVLIALAAVLVLVWLRYRLKKALSEFGKAMEAQVTPQTLKFTLDRAGVEDFADEYDAQSAAQELTRAGLTEGGRYLVRESPGQKLILFADPAREVIAAITVLPSIGLSVDVITAYDDGRFLIHHSMRSVDLDCPPEHRHVVVEGAAPAELLRMHLADRGAAPRHRYAPEDVAHVLSEYNAKIDLWRNARAGDSTNELRRRRSTSTPWTNQ